MFKRRLTSPGVPQVGIFWFIQEPGLSAALLVDGVALVDGEPYGEYINYPAEHSSCWPDVKQHLSPFFHDCEWRDWPRGRVLYNTKAVRFEVCLNEQLQKPRFEAEILAFFNLREANTYFMSDPHYTEARFTLDLRGSVEGPV